MIRKGGAIQERVSSHVMVRGGAGGVGDPGGREGWGDCFHSSVYGPSPCSLLLKATTNMMEYSKDRQGSLLQVTGP